MALFARFLSVALFVTGSRLPSLSRSLSINVNNEIWIVVPAYNEQRQIDATLSGLTRKYENVILVDDGSADATYDRAGEHPVHRLRHVINLGQGASLRTGMDYALLRGAETIVTFDGDGQHQASDIDALIAPIQKSEADVVLGSRFLGHASGMPWGRKLVLKGGILFTRLMSRIRVTDTHNGLRAFSRMAAKAIVIEENGMAHASEILDEISRLGLRYQEVGVTVHYTTQSLEKGQSNWNALRIAGKLMVGRLLR